MNSKISDRLQQLLARPSACQSVPLNISIKRGISAATVKASIEQVRRLADNQQTVEYIPISSTIHCRVPLTEVDRLNEMPQIEWIDLEKERPLEELLD